jgi:uncharacterized membrane protein
MGNATAPHLLNILVHVGAGLAAMALGFYLLWKPKGTRQHRKVGRMFVYLAVVVCASAAAGIALFRFLPLFAVLTLLVSYQLLSGWHVVHTRASGPDAVDALLWLGAAALAAWLIVHLAGVGASSPVLVSTLAALGTLLVYDAARWLFPKPWHAMLWRYEHIYKLVASLFGMLSAAVGNTVRAGQPWSQLLPSLLGAIVIAWFWTRTWRKQRRTALIAHLG